jgi:signal peptidase I
MTPCAARPLPFVQAGTLPFRLDFHSTSRADATIANRPQSMVLCGAMKPDFARLFLVVLLVCSVSCQAANKVFTVPNSSMEPTIRQGEKIAADMEPFQPTHGDLVIFVHEEILVVKRVIGIPRDVVEGHDFKVFVNGKLLKEEYVEHTAKLPLSLKTLETFGPITVPDGKLFVAGDNRDYSLDSRDPRFGLVEASDVKCKAVKIVQSSAPDRLGKKIE